MLCNGPLEHSWAAMVAPVHGQSCSTQWHCAHERLLQTDGLSGSQGVSVMRFLRGYCRIKITEAGSGQ